MVEDKDTGNPAFESFAGSELLKKSFQGASLARPQVPSPSPLPAATQPETSGGSNVRPEKDGK